jgi:hypothetical protein
MHMRTTTTTTAATLRNLTLTASLVVVLAATSPLAARPTRETPREPESPIVRKAKQVIQRVFGIQLTEATITLPKP